MSITITDVCSMIRTQLNEMGILPTTGVTPARPQGVDIHFRVTRERSYIVVRGICNVPSVGTTISVDSDWTSAWTTISTMLGILGKCATEARYGTGAYDQPFDQLLLSEMAARRAFLGMPEVPA